MVSEDLVTYLQVRQPVLALARRAKEIVRGFLGLFWSTMKFRG